MADWKIVNISEYLTESKCVILNPNSLKRITVRLNAKGVEPRTSVNEKIGATKYYRRKAGQFIYGRQNLHKGAFGVIPKELDGFESSADLPCFDVKNGFMAEWLVAWLKKGKRYESLSKLTRGVGSKRISPDDFLNLKIPLPPEEIQKKRLNKLQSAEHIIMSFNDELIYQSLLISQLRQAILQEAIEGKLTAEWRKQKPELISGENHASKLLAKIRVEKEQLFKEGKIKKEKLLPPNTDEEKPFVLPEGWMWVRLVDLVSLLGDGLHGTPIYSNEGEYFFINGNNLNEGKILIKDNTKRVSLEEYNKHKKELTNRTILVSINGTLGNVAFFNNEKIILGKSACYFNLLEGISKYYIKQIIRTKYFLIYASDKASETTIKNLSLKGMKMFLVPFPPFSEQQVVVERTDKLMVMIDELEKKITEHKNQSEMLMQSVLRDAFTE